MLYPLRLIREERLPAASPSAPLPAAARVLSVVRTLNDLFEETPAVLLPAGGRTTTLLYRDVVYLWQDLADNLSGIAATINPPLRFLGTTEARETAELSFRPDGEAIAASLRSPSGREFDHLQGLGVQADWPDPETAARMAELLAAVP